MKKLFSKLALVSVAMVGLFTSCEIEDIQTTFDLNPAQCTINVHVLYALTGEDVTSKATITSDFGNGAVITIPANSHKAIDPQDVKITASLNYLPAETKVCSIAALAAGADASYEVWFTFGGDEDIYYEYNTIAEKLDPQTMYLTNPHYSHADGEANWLYNGSDFILEAEVEFEEFEGAEALNPKPAAGGEEIINDCVKNINDEQGPIKAKRETKKETFNVSAWAAYQAWVTRTFKTETIEVIEVNKVLETRTNLGTYDFKTVESNIFGSQEKAYPGHEGHYIEGHGHGIGGNNAGGGLFWND